MQSSLRPNAFGTVKNPGNVSLALRCLNVPMKSPVLFPFDHNDYDAAASEAVVTMSEDLGRTICVARVLVEHGRTVDLTGLDRGVGLLCAKALDLPADSGRRLRAHLLMLLAEADGLTQALRTQAES